MCSILFYIICEKAFIAYVYNYYLFFIVIYMSYKSDANERLSAYLRLHGNTK